MIQNSQMAITSQQAGKRNYKAVTGADLISLAGDKPRRPDKTGAELLAEAKEAFISRGYDWNPQKRAEA